MDPPFPASSSTLQRLQPLFPQTLIENALVVPATENFNGYSLSSMSAGMGPGVGVGLGMSTGNPYTAFRTPAPPKPARKYKPRKPPKPPRSQAAASPGTDGTAATATRPRKKTAAPKASKRRAAFSPAPAADDGDANVLGPLALHNSAAQNSAATPIQKAKKRKRMVTPGSAAPSSSAAASGEGSAQWASPAAKKKKVGAKRKVREKLLKKKHKRSAVAQPDDDSAAVTAGTAPSENLEQAEAPAAKGKLAPVVVLPSGLFASECECQTTICSLRRRPYINVWELFIVVVVFVCLVCFFLCVWCVVLLWYVCMCACVLHWSQVPAMMHGFGDDREPLQESVDLIEQMVVDYMVTLVRQALRVSSTKLKTEDLLFAVRKDRPKYERAQTLLKINRELLQLRKPTLNFEK